MKNIIPIVIVISLLIYIFKEKDRVLLVLMLTLYSDITNTLFFNLGFYSNKLLFRIILFILGLVFFATKSNWKTFSNTIIHHPIFKTFIFLYILLVIRTFLGENIIQSDFIFLRKFTTHVFLPFISISILLNNKRELYEIPKKFLFLSIIYFILIGFFSQSVSLSELEIGNRTSYYLSPIYLSRINAIMIIGSIIYIPISKFLLKYYYIIVLVSGSLILLLFAPQRGTVLGIGFSYAVLFFYNRKDKLIRKQMILIIFAVAIINYSGLADMVLEKRMEELQNYQKFERYQDYFNVYKIVQEHTITGLGVRGYSKLDKMQRSPHNFIMELTANHGLIGTTIALIILFFAFKIVITILKTKQNIELTMIAQSWLILFVSVMVSGALSSNYEFFSFTAFLMLIDSAILKEKVLFKRSKLVTANS